LEIDICNNSVNLLFT